MTSSRPYLLRAMHEWMLDNHMTPHILVDADVEGVEVPEHFIDDGKIVLNISPISVRGLEINNERITFNARFGGRPYQINVPMESVLAVYAKENGKGMIFTREENGEQPQQQSSRPEKKTHLKVVK